MQVIPKAQMRLSLLPADSGANPILSVLTSKKQKIKDKQKFLQKHGYKDVKADGNWGPWQEKQYQKLQKQLAENSNVVSKAVATVVEPVVHNLKRFQGRVKEAVKNPTVKNIVSATTNGVRSMLETPVVPITPVIEKIPIVRTVVPYFDLTHTASFFDPNYKFGDGTYTQHNYEQLGLPILDDVVGISNFVVPVKVGNFTKTFKNNFTNKNNVSRFFLDNIRPASYRGQTKNIFRFIYDMGTKEEAPTFFDHKPKWYKNDLLGSNQVRFETWARRLGIPEYEVPNTTIYRRTDGTWGFTPSALEQAKNPLTSGFRTLNLEELKGKDFVRMPDWLTTVGGEHSDFIKLGEQNGYSVYRYLDNQVLNPQWIIASGLKKLGVPAKYIDTLGGKDLAPLVGGNVPVLFRQEFAFETKNPYHGPIYFNYQ